MTDQQLKANNDNFSTGDAAYRYYLVAFVDILGQKDRLRKIKSLPDTSNQTEFDTFAKLVKETHGTVLSFRSLFLRFFNAMYKPRPTPSQLAPEQAEIYDQIRQRSEKLKPTIFAFSDTVVIYVPLSDDSMVIQIDGILSTILATSGAFLGSISLGYIFRGGIEIGLAREISANEIYGPALVQAYDLERIVAKYPRVVVGNELISFLKQTEENDDTKTPLTANKYIARKCLDLFMIDIDGRYAIDYLGKEYNEFSQSQFPDIVEKVSLFLENAFSDIRKERNTELALRYSWLADYFESRLSFWQQAEKA